MSKFQSTKVFDGYSCVFRQWRAEGTHCRFLHGYGVSFKVWFEGELDEKNWVWDFGGMKRAKGTIDGVAVDSKNIIGVTAQANLHVDATSGYEIITIEKGASLMSSIQKINASIKNSLVLVDESFKDSFGRLMGLKNNIKEGQKNIIFVFFAFFFR